MRAPGAHRPRDHPPLRRHVGYESATMKGIVNHRRGVDLLQSLPFVDAVDGAFAAKFTRE